MMGEHWTYEKAGVHIDLADQTVERIKVLVEKTGRPEVIAGVGGFSGVFRLSGGGSSPCLVAGTDGVGTKLKVAFALGRHDTVGIDLVAMCVNDVLCVGAEPLFFLDYFACGTLDADTLEAVVGGVAEGCRMAGCALLGGETAEMPGMYLPGEYDLAGFTVGLVDEKKMIDGQSIRPGDLVLALPSSGLHSNGFSLVRKVLDTAGISYDAIIDGHPVADELLRPTRIYTRPVLSLIQQVPVKGIAHITGSGIPGNVPRILPPGCGIRIDRKSISLPWIFSIIQQLGNIPDQDMWKTFNMGIGLVLIIGKNDLTSTLHVLSEKGEHPWICGEVIPGERKVDVVG
ncbi:MAG: phosphoribosylformylglycinamidine cyclo-ligase [Candidatus Atribacteria bacterium]|nr:phosphoribosylformylglycinamidine cyclo-ligase [Candidatus Atribacteria bacterium]